MDDTAIMRTLVHLLVAAMLTAPIALLILWRYRASINRWMRKSGEVPPALPPPLAWREGRPAIHWTDLRGTSELDPAADELFRTGRRAAQTAGVVHGVAGLLHAAATTVIIYRSGAHASLTASLAFVLWLVLSWPSAVFVGKIAVASRSRRWALLLGLTSVIVMCAAVVAPIGPALSLMAILAGIYVLPPLLLIVAVSAPRWRSAGLFTLPSVFLGMTLIRHAHIAEGGKFGLLTILAAVFATGAVALAWRVIAWWYRKKCTSDLELTLDFEWAILTVWQCFCLRAMTGQFFIWSLVPFVVYKAAVVVGHRLAVQYPAENRRLLLLRTFGSRGRSEWLLDEVSVWWRRVGSIQLIGAPDVAGANLDAQKFLAFVTGRAREFFVSDSRSLAFRLDTMDGLPDPDRRFRINECYCFDRIWQDAVRHLIAGTTVVLMDLRGYSRERSGCSTELRLLFDHISLRRVVFLTDATTQSAELESLLQSIWRECRQTSPNRTIEAIHLLRATDHSSVTTRVLFQRMCVAAAIPAHS